MMRIEVTYTSYSQNQYLIPVNIEDACTVKEAILHSKICEQCPEIDLEQNKVGIFSKQVTLDHLVNNGDRIEIYRQLQLDPKQARKIRAKIPRT